MRRTTRIAGTIVGVVLAASAGAGVCVETAIAAGTPKTGPSSSAGEEAHILKPLMSLDGYHVTRIQYDTSDPAGPNASFEAKHTRTTVYVVVYDDRRAALRDEAAFVRSGASKRGAYELVGDAVVFALGRGSGPRDAVAAAAKAIRGVA